MPRATKSKSTATPTRTSSRLAAASSSQPYPKTRPQSNSKAKSGAIVDVQNLPPSDTPIISSSSALPNVEPQSQPTGRRSRSSKAKEPKPKPGDADYDGRKDHIYPHKPDGIILMAHFRNVSETPTLEDCAKLAIQVGRRGQARKIHTWFGNRKQLEGRKLLRMRLKAPKSTPKRKAQGTKVRKGAQGGSTKARAPVILEHQQSVESEDPPLVDPPVLSDGPSASSSTSTSTFTSTSTSTPPSASPMFPEASGSSTDTSKASSLTGQGGSDSERSVATMDEADLEAATFLASRFGGGDGVSTPLTASGVMPEDLSVMVSSLGRWGRKVMMC